MQIVNFSSIETPVIGNRQGVDLLCRLAPGRIIDYAQFGERVPVLGDLRGAQRIAPWRTEPSWGRACAKRSMMRPKFRSSTFTYMNFSLLEWSPIMRW